MQGHLSRAEVVALMKRTRSVSNLHAFPTHITMSRVTCHSC